MIVSARTHIGNVRKNNEDSILVSENKIGDFDNLFIVADGMGGHNSGEIASSSAVFFLEDYYKSNSVELDTECTIIDSIFCANQKVFELSQSDNIYDGMGTTVTLCTIIDNKACFGNVGDSRAYIFSDEKLVQITNDHTFVNVMVQTGQMTKEQATVDPNRNMITRAVGVKPTVRVDYFEKEVSENNIILLCSDGLTGMVSDEKINDILKNSELDIFEKCDLLVVNALENGGLDNVSIILILV